MFCFFDGPRKILAGLEHIGFRVWVSKSDSLDKVMVPLTHKKHIGINIQGVLSHVGIDGNEEPDSWVPQRSQCSLPDVPAKREIIERWSDLGTEEMSDEDEMGPGLWWQFQ